MSNASTSTTASGRSEGFGRPLTPVLLEPNYPGASDVYNPIMAQAM